MNPLSLISNTSDLGGIAKELVQVVKGDPYVSSSDKELAETHLQNIPFVARLLAGAVGAELGNILGKYKKMPPKTRTLIAIAGFGLGQLVLKEIYKERDKFARYNHQTRLYEIEQ